MISLHLEQAPGDNFNFYRANRDIREFQRFLLRDSPYIEWFVANRDNPLEFHVELAPGKTMRCVIRQAHLELFLGGQRMEIEQAGRVYAAWQELAKSDGINVEQAMASLRDIAVLDGGESSLPQELLRKSMRDTVKPIRRWALISSWAYSISRALETRSCKTVLIPAYVEDEQDAGWQLLLRMGECCDVIIRASISVKIGHGAQG